MDISDEKLGTLLEEFKGLRDDLARAMVMFDMRISKCERKLDKEAQEREEADAATQKKIEELVAKIGELAQNPAWRSADGERVGLDRVEAYDWFDRIGLTRDEALDALYKKGYLVRDKQGKNTVVARRGRHSERMVMIKNYGNISIS